MAALSAIFIFLFTTCIFSVRCLTFDERVKKLDALLQSVTADNGLITEQIGDVETHLGNDRAGNIELQDRLSIIDEVQKAQTKKLKAIRFKLIDKIKRNEKDGGESNQYQKRQLHTPTICFTAVISKTDLANLNSGTPIIFDQEITNVGQGYNTSSGVFESPISGLYVFNMDIMVEDGENEYLQFIKDSAHVMYNYAHASGALHDESSSRMVVLELKKGNRVWVQTAPGTHHGSGNLHGNGFTTFSGWLLAITE